MRRNMQPNHDRQEFKEVPIADVPPTNSLPDEAHPSGHLITHCGAHKITREELHLLPVPEATRTHRPIPHAEIVAILLETLSFRYIAVVRDEYAVTRDGMRMFGVLDLDAEFNGCRFSIGIRNANDKSMRLAMTIGYRVFVCDNLAFKGDFTPVLAKHSRNLELMDVISAGVDKMQRNFEPLKRIVARWQEHTLTDSQVKVILYDAFIERKLPVPRALLAEVARRYFEPEFEAFRPRTLWSLSNAFTSAFKELAPIRQYLITAKLGSFLQTYTLPF